MLDAKGDPANPSHALRSARAIDPARTADPRIRTDIVGQAASQVAAIPEVRQTLLAFQRDFAAWPPAGAMGAVIDGRDIGTVIVPAATAKLFIDAKPEVRARRRLLELESLGIRREFAQLLAELNARDAADRSRSISPLKPAPDAILLDTSDLGIDRAFEAALALVDPKVKTALATRPRG